MWVHLCHMIPPPPSMVCWYMGALTRAKLPQLHLLSQKCEMWRSKGAQMRSVPINGRNSVKEHILREIVTHSHCRWECKMVQQLWKMVWRFFQKLIIELSYDLAVLLLGLYPKELETGMQTTYASMFTATLFTICKWWKQPKCPSYRLGNWGMERIGQIFRPWSHRWEMVEPGFELRPSGPRIHALNHYTPLLEEWMFHFT